MAGFQVNSHSLRSLQQAVLGLAVELDGGGQSMAPYGFTSRPDPTTNYSTTIDNYGELNGADGPMGDFFTAWQVSLAVIGNNIETLSKKLGSAADEYAANEQSLRSLEILLNPNRPAPSTPPPKTTSNGQWFDQYIQGLSGK